MLHIFLVHQWKDISVFFFHSLLLFNTVTMNIAVQVSMRENVEYGDMDYINECSQAFINMEKMSLKLG